MADAGREAEEAEAGREKAREEVEEVGREGCVVVATPPSILFKGATSLSPKAQKQVRERHLEGSKKQDK